MLEAEPIGQRGGIRTNLQREVAATSTKLASPNLTGWRDRQESTQLAIDIVATNTAEMERLKKN
jgi:hypothetical protein